MVVVAMAEAVTAARLEDSGGAGGYWVMMAGACGGRKGGRRIVMAVVAMRWRGGDDGLGTEPYLVLDCLHTCGADVQRQTRTTHTALQLVASDALVATQS